MRENPISKTRDLRFGCLEQSGPGKRKAEAGYERDGGVGIRPQAPNIVPMKEPNEGRPGQPEEVLEGRAGAKENRGESRTDPTQRGFPCHWDSSLCADERGGATSPKFADAMIQGRSRMR